MRKSTSGHMQSICEHWCQDRHRQTLALRLRVHRHRLSLWVLPLSSQMQVGPPEWQRHQQPSFWGMKMVQSSDVLRLQFIVNTGQLFQLVARQLEMHTSLWSTMPMGTQWESGMCGISVLKLVNRSSPKSSRGSSHRRMTLCIPWVRCRTTSHLIQRMALSDPSLLTWSGIRSTKLLSSHRPRLWMKASPSFGILQEARTFHRMQFATPRMALLQDSLRPIQEGFGNPWPATCKNSSRRFPSHISRILSMSRCQLSGMTFWIHINSSMHLQVSARSGFPSRAQPDVWHNPSQPARAHPRRFSQCYIYIYIYAVKLLSGPSLAISGVIIWAK